MVVTVVGPGGVGEGAAQVRSLEFGELGARELIKRGGARFTEKITENVPRCENDSRITIKKLSDTRASCTFFSTHVGAVVATAVITKNSS